MEVAIFAFEEDICALRQTTATAIFIPLTEPLRFDYGYKYKRIYSFYLSE